MKLQKQASLTAEQIYRPAICQSRLPGRKQNVASKNPVCQKKTPDPSQQSLTALLESENFRRKWVAEMPAIRFRLQQLRGA